MTRTIKTILVLEGDSAVRFALGRVSLGAGIQLVFEDPDEWMTVESNCALVLCDDSILQGMGDKLPLELIKERLSCPVILMTNISNRRIERYAREAGAAAVLFKPFSAGELRRQVGEVIGGIEIPVKELPVPTDLDSTPVASVYRPVDFGGQIAGDQVFDNLFIELEKRQPLEEGLDAFDVVERQLVKRALLSCEGNQSQAARFLGITRNTLRKRIRKYGFSGLLEADDA